ncbi:MAG: permease prefix domain 1-containing protein [Microbacterium sp.]
MSDTHLTDRNIAAAMRTVPEKQRDDLAAELRASIDDQIDARVGDGEPHGIAERAVLTELGDPEKLAAGYTERPLHLIGPRYYLEWWRLLKLLWWIVVPLAALGISLGQVLSGAAFGEVVGATAVGAFTVALHVAFWVTLVFAILERTSGTSPLERNALTKDGPWAPWTLDQLPELRPAGVGVAELVASLVFLGLAAFAVVWDQLVGFVWVDGLTQPVLNPALWPWWIAGLLAILALEAVFAIVLFRTRRWTPALAVVNAVLALAVAIPAVVLLAQGALLNHAFFTEVLPADSAEEVYGVLSTITGFGIVIIAGWDIVDGALKTWRASRSMGEAAARGPLVGS